MVGHCVDVGIQFVGVFWVQASNVNNREGGEVGCTSLMLNLRPLACRILVRFLGLRSLHKESRRLFCRDLRLGQALEYPL